MNVCYDECFVSRMGSGVTGAGLLMLSEVTENYYVSKKGGFMEMLNVIYEVYVVPNDQTVFRCDEQCCY
jgi:hypothetical protein